MILRHLRDNKRVGTSNKRMLYGSRSYVHPHFFVDKLKNECWTDWELATGKNVEQGTGHWELVTGI